MRRERKVYLVDPNYGIQEMGYSAALREAAEECTTPNGVAPRCFADGRRLFRWRLSGKPEEMGKYETTQEAEEALFRCWERDLAEHPSLVLFGSMEEAEEFLRED